jgi:endonuclease I
LILDEDKKKELKGIFTSFLDLEDQKKDISNQEKDLKDEAASILEVKKGIVAKIFSYMKKKYEKGEDELEQIYEIMEQIED